MSSCAEFEGTTSKAYLGRDNTVTVIPYSDVAARTNFDLSTATRITAAADLVDSAVSGDAITADSDVDADVVRWAEVDGEWRIHLVPGRFTDMVPGVYNIEVVIYTPDYPNGLVLEDSESALRVEVVGTP